MTELKRYFQALAIKKVLKECISSLEIKKVLPPYEDLSHYEQMPIALFNWNFGLDERRLNSMVQLGILLKLVSLKSLEQQKTAMDYQQLILLLNKLLLCFDADNQITDILEIFDAAKQSLETIESLKTEYNALKEEKKRRSIKLKDEVEILDFRNKKSKQNSLDGSSHPMTAFIAGDIKAKYYQQFELAIDDKFEMERTKIQNQIDNLLLLIKKEAFCAEQIAMTYKGEAYYYSYRIEKLTEVFDVERSKIEEEVAAKLSEITKIREMSSKLYDKMLYYRHKIQEHLTNYQPTPSSRSSLDN